MLDFLSSLQQHQDLPEDKQKQIGQAGGDDMGEEHKNFLATLIKLIDAKEIDPSKPESFLVRDVYDKLDDFPRSKVDFSLPTIADLVRQIEDFFRSKATPNASPELQNMIEHLWQMKERLEKKFGNVFKF